MTNLENQARRLEDLADKLALSRRIISDSYRSFPNSRRVIAWTGGKDSTLLLWLFKQLREKVGLETPRCLLIDEGDVFEEVTRFVGRISGDWGVIVDRVRNDEICDLAGGVLGTVIKVSDLGQRNRAEVKRLGFDGETFPYEPESLIGNHLMKTVPLIRYITENDIDLLYEGIRWDEQESRANETFFSLREETTFSRRHIRIFPILHITEGEIWQAHLSFKIPFNELYQQGFRSIGAKSTTTKISDKPAWEQDLLTTKERSGRRQDKEKIMERLRKLGYM